MEFTWDAVKSEVTRRTRGFDFAFATLMFDAPCVIVRDERGDCGPQTHLSQTQQPTGAQDP